MMPVNRLEPPADRLSLAELLELLTAELESRGTIEPAAWALSFPDWDPVIDDLCCLLDRLTELIQSEDDRPQEAAGTGRPDGAPSDRPATGMSGLPGMYCSTADWGRGSGSSLNGPKCRTPSESPSP